MEAVKRWWSRVVERNDTNVACVGHTVGWRGCAKGLAMLSDNPTSVGSIPGGAPGAKEKCSRACVSGLL